LQPARLTGGPLHLVFPGVIPNPRGFGGLRDLFFALGLLRKSNYLLHSIDFLRVISNSNFHKLK
jgi:hypothetical protein